ncbi:MAG: hypothetical protein HYZ53_05970 [Planctomycetes bacterium]|nr:hypothetical protein [Planctomycetota bacterium]
MKLQSLPLTLRRRWQTAGLVLTAVAGLAAGSCLGNRPPAGAKARVLVRAGGADTQAMVEAAALSPRTLEVALDELSAGRADAGGEAALAALREAVTLTRTTGGGPVVDVRAQAGEPELACRRANAVARALVQVISADARRGTENALFAVRRGLETARARREALREELSVLTGPGGDPESEQAVLLATLRELEVRIDGHRATAAQREEEMRGLIAISGARPGTGGARTLPASAAVPALEERVAALEQAQGELRRIQEIRFDGDPLVEAKRAEVAGLEAELVADQEKWRSRRQANLQSEVNRAQREVEACERRRADRRKELALVNDRLARLRVVRRELEGVERELERGQEEDRHHATVLAGLSNPAEVTNLAETAELPPRMNWGMAALWVLAGLVGACAAALLREALDPRIAGEEEARRLLELPVVGHLPLAGAAEVAGGIAGARDASLTEVFGSIATLLRASLGEGGMKTVGILSAVPGEGKTTVAVGLACALARKGLRTVLIDANLRSPRVHEVAGIENTNGLATLLEGRWPAPASGRFGGPADMSQPSDLDLSMQEHLYPGLRIIPAGTPPENPQLLLESDSMKGILAELKEIADVVIVDTPALGSVGEGLTMATMTDVNILVVGAGVATRGELAWTRRLLGSVPANLLGFLVEFSSWTPSRQAARRSAKAKRAVAVQAV